jgi:hypothetical protein
MRKGKWRVFTMRKGHRPQWETFDANWMIRLIETEFIAPIGDARKAVCEEWVRDITKREYDRVLLDMKTIGMCMKSRFADTVTSWNQYMGTLKLTTQVKCEA